MGRGDKAPYIRNMGTVWKWIFSFTLQLLYSR